jgi:uncharacterized DUF497 family protein
VVISGFDWDDDNVSHIERHQFNPEEVEEVFAGSYKVRRTRQKLYLALGETLDGRLAFVVFRRFSGGVIRVITRAIWMTASGASSGASRLAA